MKLRLSKHAIERYRQRARPLSFKMAKAELEAMMEHAVWEDRVPDWANSVSEHDGCLVLADLALIVQDDTIVTCISKGTLAPGQRQHRRIKKKERRERLARRRGL